MLLHKMPPLNKLPMLLPRKRPLLLKKLHPLRRLHLRLLHLKRHRK